MLHGRNRPFPRSRGAPGNAPTQAEATSWQAAVVTNAGTVSAGRFQIVNNFIAAEKAAGTWALTDDYWGLWAENVPQALTSLKQLRLATVVSAPIFTTDRGYSFDGAANYINTGFLPATHALVMTGTTMRIAVYERFNNASSGRYGDFDNGTDKNCFLCPRDAANALHLSMNAAVVSVGSGTILSSLGFSVGSRSSATYTGYKNGLAVGTGSPGTSGTILPTAAVSLGALNTTTVPVNFRNTACGFACIGAALSAAQEQAQYTNVQAWATAVGAQV